jgi:hypothetical protein
MSGAVQPASSMLLDFGTAAGFWRSTVTYHFGPASGQLCTAPWRAHQPSVIVIDWTTIGAPPPTWTIVPEPTLTPTVLWSLTGFM